ncbi:hypothetical protein [Phreatobacter sp.]|uniref:hypothetical protein n=1 Tax=Phreatobacter sp. TaxID=1966341 RepID=UPI003F70FCEE
MLMVDEGSPPSGGASPDHRIGRFVAAGLAVIVAVHLVLAVVPALFQGGLPSDQATSPLRYWVHLGIGVAVLIYLLAVTSGSIAHQHDPLEWEERKHRNRVGATGFGLLGCAVLLYVWVQDRPADGFSREHNVLGLGIAGLLGFLAMTAPLPPGRLNVLCKIAGIVLASSAWIAVSYV